MAAGKTFPRFASLAPQEPTSPRRLNVTPSCNYREWQRIFKTPATGPNKDGEWKDKVHFVAPAACGESAITSFTVDGVTHHRCAKHLSKRPPDRKVKRRKLTKAELAEYEAGRLKL